MSSGHDLGCGWRASPGVITFAVGCASHSASSDVLDDLYKFAKENRCGWGFADGVDAYRTELRQHNAEWTER